MKGILLLGIALIAVGAFLLFRGSVTSRRDVLDVGGLTVTAEEERPINPWIGAVVLLGGVALVIQGARGKR